MNRNNRLREWVGLLLLSVGPLQWVAAAEPLRPLAHYPVLAETFPFGFWYAQAPEDERLAGAFQETYQQRRVKLFHHLAQHSTNVLITANRNAAIEPLDVAGQYGIRLISSAEFLHSHVNHAGEETGEATMEQVLERAAAHATEVKSLGIKPRNPAHSIFAGLGHPVRRRI